MNCSRRRLSRWIDYHAFPLDIWFYPFSRHHGGSGWAYCAYEERIQQWFAANEAIARQRWSKTKTALLFRLKAPKSYRVEPLLQRTVGQTAEASLKQADEIVLQDKPRLSSTVLKG